MSLHIEENQTILQIQANITVGRLGELKLEISLLHCRTIEGGLQGLLVVKQRLDVFAMFRGLLDKERVEVLENSNFKDLVVRRLAIRLGFMGRDLLGSIYWAVHKLGPVQINVTAIDPTSNDDWHQSLCVGTKLWCNHCGCLPITLT
ncbi:uncharacterized protein G2W53_044263 [Senna tora]|uniref:Uncharacterized protein n=1 Tax=Senna tora TaxID=362788 RepID=A0A834SK56_9FABA|nr:uncharacterized protein G2W53_044263 [Senna tora]